MITSKRAPVGKHCATKPIEHSEPRAPKISWAPKMPKAPRAPRGPKEPKTPKVPRVRKRLNIGLLVLMVCAVVAVASVVGVSMAYFTDTDAVTNTFTVGNVDIIPTEPNFTGLTTPAVPNQEVSKDPYIANNGSEETLVFLTVQVPVDKVTLATADGRKGTTEETELYWMKRSDVSADTWANSFHDTAAGGNWVQLSYTKGSAGGYSTYVFGYQKALGPSSTTISNVTDQNEINKLDSKTEPLFDKVQLKNIVEETAYGTKNIIINAYGIQAAYLADGEGTALTESLFPGGVFDASATLTKDQLAKVYAICTAQG